MAFVNRKDTYHNWTIQQFAILEPPILTCEAVISEACFLLKNYPDGIVTIFELLERGLIRIHFRLEDDLEAIAALMSSYKDVPVSLADACLVRMAEHVASGTIFTIDRDFRIYRKNKRQTIPTIMPPDFK